MSTKEKLVTCQLTVFRQETYGRDHFMAWLGGERCHKSVLEIWLIMAQKSARLGISVLFCFCLSVVVFVLFSFPSNVEHS